MKPAILAAALILLPLAGKADLEDYERARGALERREVLPLREILPMIEPEIKGRIVEIEFDLGESSYVYEFEFIDPGGRLMKAVVDAKTGGILSIAEDIED